MIVMIVLIGMSGMIVKEERNRLEQARNDMLWTRRLF